MTTKAKKKKTEEGKLKEEEPDKVQASPSLHPASDGAENEDKYILRPPYEQKFKPTTVKPLIHEVRSVEQSIH